MAEQTLRYRRPCFADRNETAVEHELIINSCPALRLIALFLIPRQLSAGKEASIRSRFNPTEHSEWHCRPGFRARYFVGLFLLALSCTQAFSETIRVTTWDLLATRGTDSDRTVQEAASAIAKADPDILFLQHVRDWKMCQQLADLLKPAMYNVLVCSAFQDPRGGSNRQAAVLSKRKAYFAGAEVWQMPTNASITGGIVFSAIQAGRHRVGVFSVMLEEQGAISGKKDDPVMAQAEAACQQQWVEKMESFRNWTTNRLEAALVGGAFGLAPATRMEGRDIFAQAFLTAPIVAGRLQPAGEYVAAHVAANADILPGIALVRSTTTCDVDLDADLGHGVLADLVANRSTGPDAARLNTAGPQSVAASESTFFPTTPRGVLLFWLGLLAATVLMFGLGFWLLSRRVEASVNRLPNAAQLRLEGVNKGSQVMVITSGSITRSSSDPPPDAQLQAWQQRALAAEQRAERADSLLRTGMMPHLRQWLRENLFRKLLADRTALLETQQAATMKAKAVDERLSRIEQQLQKQNRTYELRIEQLTRELAAAKEESRALIRAQIAAVKAEMAAARERLLAEAGPL